MPFAIAFEIKVPWQLANRQQQIRLELIDSEGRPVAPLSDEGEEADPVVLDLPPFEVGRPPGLIPGTPLDHPLAINFATGIPLAPGRYEWRLTINGQAHEDWSLAFTVRAQPPQAMAA